MKVWYVTNVRLPTEKVHGYQIMKMCEAFAAAVGTRSGLVSPKCLLVDIPWQSINASVRYFRLILKLPL